jgi:hypothetical protein
MTVRYADLRIAEADLHKSVAALLDVVLLPPALWTTFPAGYGKLGKATAGHLRGVGLKAGMPDIMIFHKGRCFGIELKVPGGKLSKDQFEMHELLAEAGVPVEVCYNLEDVVTALIGFNLPIRDLEIAA